MIKTISFKLFLIFFTAMALTTGLAIGFNEVGLQPYYVMKNKAYFENFAKTFEEKTQLSIEEASAYGNMIDQLEGISFTLSDSDYNVLYNSFPEKLDGTRSKLPIEIEDMIEKAKGQSGGSTAGIRVYGPVSKPKEQATKLVYAIQLENGKYLILRKAMSGIEESVDIANEFALYSGLFIVALGSIAVFLFSKKVSKPLVELSQVAEAIADMDFSKAIDSNREDELGSLMRSVRKMSRNLEHSIQTLQKDVLRRKDLVRNISHEMKTPIGVIKGYTEGLKFGVASEPEQVQRYYQVIIDECDRMDDMVKALLDLSQLESKEFSVNPEAINVSKMVQRLLTQFEMQLSASSIQLEISVPVDLTVYADPLWLERALTNYLVNALRHVDERKRILIEALPQGERHCIRVFNSGEGISDDVGERIWEVFYKDDSARRRESPGHGIGLSLVKQVVLLHGGLYGYENTDHGVFFYICL